MNTHETATRPVADIDRYTIRREAELLRAELAGQFVRRIFKSIAAFYAKLAEHGATMSETYRTPKALY